MKHTNNPTEAFIEAVNSLVVLSQVARQQLNECLNVRCFDPRHLLLPKSHTFDGVFFIHSGLVRGVYQNALGEETSVWFVAEGDFIPPVYDMPDGSPSVKSVEMLEESTIVWLNRDDLNELYELFPETLPLEHRISQLHLARVTEILRSFRIHTNKEFYKWLLKRFPQWAHRVKDKHLASFMGISPSALSRIRGSKN